MALMDFFVWPQVAKKVSTTVGIMQPLISFSFNKEIFIAGQGPSPGAEQGGAKSQDRGGLGGAGAGVHQERGRQHAEASAGHHQRVRRATPEGLLSSSILVIP